MKGFESSELRINSINVPFAKEAECSPGRSAVSFSKLLGDLKSLEIDGYCIEDGCRVGVHFLLQYPMFGFQPVAKQETRMTTSCCRIVRVQRFFLVQSPSFGIQVMKESRKAGNESVQKETVRCSVSLLVYGKHRANLLPTGKLQRK